LLDTRRPARIASDAVLAALCAPVCLVLW